MYKVFVGQVHELLEKICTMANPDYQLFLKIYLSSTAIYHLLTTKADTALPPPPFDFFFYIFFFKSSLRNNAFDMSEFVSLQGPGTHWGLQGSPQTPCPLLCFPTVKKILHPPLHYIHIQENTRALIQIYSVTGHVTYFHKKWHI
jgi:hypothetical protein